MDTKRPSMISAVIFILLASVVVSCGSSGMPTEAGSTTANDASSSGTARAADKAAPIRASREEIEPFVIEVLRNRDEERTGPAYDVLVPQQQELFSRTQFDVCGGSGSNTEMKSLEILDVYEEPILIPGTSAEVDTTAVTVKVEFSVSGKMVTDTTTLHLVDVDGGWRWMTTERQIEECLFYVSVTSGVFDQACKGALDEYLIGAKAALNKWSAGLTNATELSNVFSDLGVSVGRSCALSDPTLVVSEMILSTATLLENSSSTISAGVSEIIDGLCESAYNDLTVAARTVCET